MRSEPDRWGAMQGTRGGNQAAKRGRRGRKGGFKDEGVGWGLKTELFCGKWD